MPGKSPSQRIDELTKEVQRLEATLDTHKQLTQLKLQVLQDENSDRKKVEEELRSKVAELTAKNAALEERARHQEKQSDRGFNFVQAAIISIISMVGGAILSLLVQLAIKK